MIYDVIIVGSGPSGINSAIYAASEGLSTLVIGKSYGGQIYSSAAVENLFSFPKVTGKQLINRAHKQALNFGATFKNDAIDTLIHTKYNTFILESKDTVYEARSIILALGVQYRTLEAHGIDKHLGTNIHSGDNVISHAQRCKGKHVYIIGGANSAGQAAVYLSKYASKVTMLVRSSLSKSMSAYLIKQIDMCNNIEVINGCVLNSVEGDQHIERIVIDQDGEEHAFCDCNSMFIFIGAEPNTAWLPKNIARDDKGYIIVNDHYETTMKGIFACGDIVAGSVKRVAVALGSSASAVSYVHKYLNI